MLPSCVWRWSTLLRTYSVITTVVADNTSSFHDRSFLFRNLLVKLSIFEMIEIHEVREMSSLSCVLRFLDHSGFALEPKVTLPFRFLLPLAHQEFFYACGNKLVNKVVVSHGKMSSVCNMILVCSPFVFFNTRSLWLNRYFFVKNWARSIETFLLNSFTFVCKKFPPAFETTFVQIRQVFERVTVAGQSCFAFWIQLLPCVVHDASPLFSLAGCNLGFSFSSLNWQSIFWPDVFKWRNNLFIRKSIANPHVSTKRT